MVPVYWKQYGPQNFLWGSDLVLFGTLAAVWLESRLLTSMMAIAALIPELLWTVDYLGRLIAGAESVPGLGTQYMFNSKIPLFVRGLSLFHLVLPPLLLWLLYRFGYERRALAYQTVLAWLVLLITYLVTEPSANINWIYGFGREPQTWMPERLYLVSLMAGIPLVFYLPTHLVLSKLFTRRSAKSND
ncbi:MAG: membrane-associated protein [Betaproteobacteria bacterium]|nr:MAG: membrane-associated protein [Betaproteobacteria bacterium]